jgi:cytochrome bd-type quinol oxidase subunit 2
MWSESFHGEERDRRRLRGSDRAVAVAAVCLAMAALGGEIVFSVQVTSQEFASREGSWPMGIVSLLLGLVGPYATILAWRNRRNAARPKLRRTTTAAAVAVVGGAVAIAWLLLIHSSLHRPPLLF